jgi:DUF4097 and DUF4098 domain-containing protein YvlB
MRILAASLFVLALASPAAAQQKETETVDRTVTIGERGRLNLKNFSGDVQITGTAGRDVVIHAVRNATRERLDNIKLDISTTSSSVSIDANKRADGWRDRNNNVVETDFEIKVPYGTKLDLDTFSGKLDVRGVTGSINAHTFSGSIDIDVASASQLPELTAETFSGNIAARVPATASGRVRFDSFSGGVRSDLPISMTSRRNRWGGGEDVDGSIGSGSGPTLRFKTFSGDLRITK